MAEHTPLPWIVREFPTAIYGRPAWWVLDSIPDNDGKVVANAICQATSTNDHAKGNAEFIALACNVHDDLFAACELALPALTELIDALDGSADPGDIKARNAVAAAITRARGK
jgi:hypothetical protein